MADRQTEIGHQELEGKRGPLKTWISWVICRFTRHRSNTIQTNEKGLPNHMFHMCTQCCSNCINENDHFYPCDLICKITSSYTNFDVDADKATRIHT